MTDLLPLPELEPVPWPDDVTFIAEVHDDWTVLQLPDHSSFAFNRTTGKVFKLPHPEAPFAVIPKLRPASPLKAAVSEEMDLLRADVSGWKRRADKEMLARYGVTARLRELLVEKYRREGVSDKEARGAAYNEIHAIEQREWDLVDQRNKFIRENGGPNYVSLTEVQIPPNPESALALRPSGGDTLSPRNEAAAIQPQPACKVTVHPMRKVSEQRPGETNVDRSVMCNWELTSTEAEVAIGLAKGRYAASGDAVAGLVGRWRAEQLGYPATSEGQHAAAAVRCCADELEAAIGAQRGEGNG